MSASVCQSSHNPRTVERIFMECDTREFVRLLAMQTRVAGRMRHRIRIVNRAFEPKAIWEIKMGLYRLKHVYLT
jgi:hypothetical protein